MKTLLAALVLVVGLSACNKRGEDTGRIGEAADTTLTTRKTQDTTIVTSDTTVHSDTVTHQGNVKRDTAKGH